MAFSQVCLIHSSFCACSCGDICTPPNGQNLLKAVASLYPNKIDVLDSSLASNFEGGTC